MIFFIFPLIEKEKKEKFKCKDEKIFDGNIREKLTMNQLKERKSDRKSSAVFHET